MLTATATRAERLATEQFEANLAALESRQPRLVDWLAEQMLEWNWLFARDGTLSGRDANDRWIGGCSVPTRLSRIVLQSIEVRGSVACFLAPGHASDIKVVFERLTPSQALLSIVPSYAELAAILHCAEFTQEITAGRAFFVAGPAWDVELERLFEDNPDLATPGNFIRLPASDETIVEPMLKSAQTLITAAGERRSLLVSRLRDGYAPPRRNKVLVVAPLRFRLWNDFEPALQSLKTTGDVDITLFDTDDPANAAPAKLVRAACEADVLMTVNTARTDLPGLLPEGLPWVSWITGGRVPSAALAGDQDRLLLVHAGLRAAAEKTGWTSEQIRIADWPLSVAPDKAGKALSLICDTSALATPKDLLAYSSHSVLWETIREELLNNPFSLGRADAYLNRHREALGINDSTFSAPRFVEQLIVPAHAQGLLRILQRNGVPVNVWGGGWDASVDGAKVWRGEISTRDQLHQALSESVALIHPFVARLGHPILQAGLPVIAATEPAGFLRLCRQAHNGRLLQTSATAPSLSSAMLRELVTEIAN